MSGHLGALWSGGTRGGAPAAVIVFLGLFGGLAADAVSKRVALVVTQTSAGILALVLGLLVAFDMVQVWHVFLLALLLGVVNSFDMPIRQAFVVEMVGHRDVANAVALNSAVFNLSRIIGALFVLAVLALIVCLLLFLREIFLAVIAPRRSAH